MYYLRKKKSSISINFTSEEKLMSFSLSIFEVYLDTIEIDVHFKLELNIYLKEIGFKYKDRDTSLLFKTCFKKVNFSIRIFKNSFK